MRLNMHRPAPCRFAPVLPSGRYSTDVWDGIYSAKTTPLTAILPT
jgi:hypothetical protein